MSITTGVLIFDDVEELDFVGPWEVFGMAANLRPDDTVVSIAENKREIRGAKGLRVLPDHDFSDAPALDVLVVPGGQGTRREIENQTTVDWIRTVSADCAWTTSVCTGSFLLQRAGLLEGKRATTHWTMIDTLRKMGGDVVDDQRYVIEGDVVTAAGVSAGIDMSLWVLGQLTSPELARQVQRLMEYDPEPPYAP